MLEDKVREVFADMVVLKDPKRSEYFSFFSEKIGDGLETYAEKQ